MGDFGLLDLDEFIDHQYGARGTDAREAFEEGYEDFKLGVIIRKFF
ncbi:MAG: hypothetical protein M3Y54_13335 [Bacteroidota bacterium]|nr:hypothetical protein [Bacteroidota bacterium]